MGAAQETTELLCGGRTEAGAACCEPLTQGTIHSWASGALPGDPVLGSMTERLRERERDLKTLKG